MSLRLRFRSLALWAAVLVVPAALNGLLWVTVFVPQQAKRQAAHDAQAARALKPKLEALITASRRLAADWERTGFLAEDPAAVMQAVRRISQAHRVEVRQMEMAGAGAAPASARAGAGLTAMPLDLEASGRFGNLARWLGEVETQAGLQVESWTLAGGAAPGEPARLTVKLTALLKAS